MSFIEQFSEASGQLSATAGAGLSLIDRFQAEADFARRMLEAHPEHAADWEPLLLQAFTLVTDAARAQTGVDVAVRHAEALLAPIGELAKSYTIHCIGHAHIDMNWLWGWQETIAVVNDTFATMDTLMEEFPDFHYSQDQASIYQLLKDYLPWVEERVKQRVREGRWEITASHWTEADKNMSSGESLCRHLLYTRRFLQREYGLPYDAVKIDWEPDTFGHAHTVPTILCQAGVSRYYFCRTGKGPHIFWWQGKDGSRVLAFDDRRKWYNNLLLPDITKHLFDFERETGLRDYLLVYGVGDHGGGPTRQDLRMAVEMDNWPIFPNVKLTTTDAYYSRIEALSPDLPVIDAELNTIFEGCMVSESEVKYTNRRSECAIVEAEAFAILAGRLAGLPYPADALYKAWQHTLFNQFHDILPGSGVPQTYTYAQGLFQEIMAQTETAKTHALRSIASRVNTAAVCGRTAPHPLDAGLRAGQGLGGGFGDTPQAGAITRYGAGGVSADPFVIINPNPWPRAEVVTARLWNRAYPPEQIVVRDDAGNVLPVQFLNKGSYWWMEHQYLEVAFPVSPIPGLGYRTVSIERSAAAPYLRPEHTATAEVTGTGYTGAESTCLSYTGPVKGILENEFLRVEVEQASGSIVHLIDKQNGIDLVPEGGRIGVLEYLHEAPGPMSAWNFGQTRHVTPLLTDWAITVQHAGPYLAVLRATRAFNDSTLTLDIALPAGQPRVDFTLNVNWLERGSQETGMPSLWAAFPLAITGGTATFEIPNGSIARPQDGYTVPAQKWVDLTGHQSGSAQLVGATLLNEAKYGYRVQDNTIRMGLLRSSYDPDPLPEIGRHIIRYALQPHIGAWSASEATRAGYACNLPLNVVGTTEHDGELPPTGGYVEILTPNIMLSAIKKAEDDDSIIVRLYEMEGQTTAARLRLPGLLSAGATAVQTDLLEQPLANNTARITGDELTVEIPPFGLVTVKVG